MSKEPGKIAVILAHPNLPESKANKELIDSINEIDYITVYNLQEELVQKMDSDAWYDVFFESSAIVFQFPLYWMSAPYMLKKWLDEIFISLSRTPVVMSKPLQLVTTAGNDCTAFRSGGRSRFTIDEILRPYQATAIHSGMTWETPIVIFGTGGPDAARSIAEGAIAYKEKLEELSLNNRAMHPFDW